MYIHNYQIHNVLNVYRKQLSQNTKGDTQSSTFPASSAGDRIHISGNGQRQSVFEKISAEIIERITQFGPKTRFEPGLGERIGDTPEPRAADNESDAGKTVLQDTHFTYTVIDEHNQKRTNTLAVRALGPRPNTTEPGAGARQDDGVTPEAN